MTISLGFHHLLAAALAGLLAAVCLQAAEAPPLPLPPPQKAGGQPLLTVLSERKSTREFGPESLSPPQLGNLLWAAFGVNRTNGQRTAPSAMNAQELDLYVATAEGLYLYDAPNHRLTPVLAGDIRAKISGQAYVKQAAVNLVFVADQARMTKAKPEERDFYAGADTGYVSQNVYLYCASEGLATVVYALGDRAGLAKAMQLRPEQKPMLGQSVGHFKK
jgi:SagB-type dehydrogenase family enzyme